jgi:hypothetical protein
VIVEDVIVLAFISLLNTTVMALFGSTSVALLAGVVLLTLGGVACAVVNEKLWLSVGASSAVPSLSPSSPVPCESFTPLDPESTVTVY